MTTQNRCIIRIGKMLNMFICPTIEIYAHGYCSYPSYSVFSIDWYINDDLVKCFLWFGFSALFISISENVCIFSPLGFQPLAHKAVNHIASLTENDTANSRRPENNNQTNTNSLDLWKIEYCKQASLSFINHMPYSFIRYELSIFTEQLAHFFYQIDVSCECVNEIFCVVVVVVAVYWLWFTSFGKWFARQSHYSTISIWLQLIELPLD